MTRIAALQREFAADRLEIERAARPSQPMTCRYCGGFRWDGPGRLLDGHTKCYVSDGFMDLLHDAMQADYRLSFKGIGEALGVSLGAVRTWYQTAAKRRRAA